MIFNSAILKKYKTIFELKSLEHLRRLILLKYFYESSSFSNKKTNMLDLNLQNAGFEMEKYKLKKTWIYRYEMF